MEPIKATLLDDDHFRLLAIPYGGPIPSKASPLGVDADGQWFSPETDIKPGWFKERPVFWHHARDPYGVMGNTVLGKATDLVQEDDGWWVDVWLKHGEKKLDLIRRLAAKAPIFGSSGSHRTLAMIRTEKGVIPWERAPKEPGELIVWPYLEQTLSTSPQNTHSILRPAKASLEAFDTAEIPVPDALKGILIDLDALGLDLRSPSLLGDDAAKAGRVLSAANEAALRKALDELSQVLGKLEKPDPVAEAFEALAD